MPPLLRRLAGPRALLLLGAVALAGAAAARPLWPRDGLAYDVMFVVDITGSMNARDQEIAGRPASRLDFVRGLLTGTIEALPCGSRAGLAIFAGRRAFMLFEPAEVCENYAPVAASIRSLDWRMAWEGDSRIADGLHDTLAMLAPGGADGPIDVVFLTDGQEAPPLPWTGGPAFAGRPGAVAGLIAGIGGDAQVPIPKFDDRGREIGFLGPGDVPHESRVGPPPPGAENRPGWHPRNNPYGEIPGGGTEHLTSLRAPYLADLAAATGLGFAAPRSPAELVAAIAANGRPRTVRAVADVSALPGALALAAAALSYIVAVFRRPRFGARAGGASAAPVTTARSRSAGSVPTRGEDVPYSPSDRSTPPSRAARSRAAAALLAVALATAGLAGPGGGPAAAHGPTPQKVEQTITLATPCELVWSTLRDFGTIGAWHPGVTAVEATGASEPGVTRTLTLANGEAITERIDDIDGAGQSLSYRLSKENLAALPVSFYTAKLATRRSDDGKGCTVDWQARLYRGDTGNFPPEELNDAAAVAALTAFFETGLAGLKEALE